jgi:predicted porin
MAKTRACDVQGRQWPRRRARRMLPAGALALLGAQLLPPAALAQEDPRIEQLQEQIEALQRQLDDLRGEVENRMPPPPERPPEAPGEPVISGNDQIRVSISGQVNRAVLVSEDGDQTKLFFVDNDNSSSRVHIEGEGEINEDLSAGAVLEVELQSNSTQQVSQDDESTGSATFQDRRVEVYFDSDRFGRLWLGQGHTASDNTAEVDLSGTAVVGTSDLPDFAGGLEFVDDGELSDVSIGDAYNNFDGLSRDDRLRYDTPSFGGFKLSASAVSDSNFDVAGFYASAFGGTKVAGAAAFASNAGDFQQVDGSASMLLAGGFNVTAAAGWRDFDDGDRDAGRYVYGKLGYLFEAFAIGATALAVDAYYGEDVGAEGDEATMVGLLAVQTVDPIATDLYFGYRHFDLSRDGADFDPINAVLSGARVKF